LFFCLALFVVLPLLNVAAGSLGGASLDFSSYAKIIADPVYSRVLWRTFEIAVAVTASCVFFGYPVAYLMTVVGPRIAAIMTAIIMVPLLTGVLIRMYAWMIILGREGVVNDVALSLGFMTEPLQLLHTSFAVHLAMLHVLSPIAIFTIYANMLQIDHELVQAAAVLGAGPIRSFLRVYLPMSLPGTMAAAVLIFVISLGYFVAPMLLGAPSDGMISQLIITHVTTLLDFQTGYALAIVLLLATIATLALAGLVIPLDLLWKPERSSAAALEGRAGSLGRVRRWARDMGWIAFALIERVMSRLLEPLIRWFPTALRVYGAAAMMFLVAPLLIVFILSLSSSEFLVFPPPGFSWRWYEKFFHAPDWHAALWFSIELGCAVALLATIIGTFGAVGIMRGRLPWRRAMFLLALSPVIVPEIILALALYAFEIKAHMLGTLPGLIVGHLVLAMPYVVVVMTSALRGLDPDLERAASVHGARPLQTIRRLHIPLLRPSLLTSYFFAFLVSFDLLLMSLFLLGRLPQTLPLKFWSDIKFQTDPLLSAASSLIVIAVIVVVAITHWWRYRGRSRAEPSVGAP
jgi:ABC-type spermidine/putrescine transport system permease subunit II